MWPRVCPHMFDVCLFVRLHIDVAFEAFHGNSRLDLDGLQRKEGREGEGRGGEGRGGEGSGGKWRGEG